MNIPVTVIDTTQGLGYRGWFTSDGTKRDLHPKYRTHMWTEFLDTIPF